MRHFANYSVWCACLLASLVPVVRCVHFMVATKEQMQIAQDMDSGKFCNIDFDEQANYDMTDAKKAGVCRNKAKEVVKVRPGFGGAAHLQQGVTTAVHDLDHNYFCPKAWIPGRAGGFRAHRSQEGCCMLDAAANVAESLYLMHQCGFSYGLGAQAKVWSTEEHSWLKRVCTIVDPMPSLDDLERRCCFSKSAGKIWKKSKSRLEAAGFKIEGGIDNHGAPETEDTLCQNLVWKTFMGVEINGLRKHYEDCVDAKEFAADFQRDPFIADCLKKERKKQIKAGTWGKGKVAPCKRPSWMGKADTSSITPRQRQMAIKLMRKAENKCKKVEAMLFKLVAKLQANAQRLYKGHDNDLTQQTLNFLQHSLNTETGRQWLKHHLSSNGGMVYDGEDLERFRKDDKLRAAAKKAGKSWRLFLGEALRRAQAHVTTVLQLRARCKNDRYASKGCEEFWGARSYWTKTDRSVYCNWYPDETECGGRAKSKSKHVTVHAKATSAEFAPEDCKKDAFAGPGCESTWPRDHTEWTSQMRISFCTWYPKHAPKLLCKCATNIVRERDCKSLWPKQRRHWTNMMWVKYCEWYPQQSRRMKLKCARHTTPAPTLPNFWKPTPHKKQGMTTDQVLLACKRRPTMDRKCLQTFPRDRREWTTDMRRAFCDWFKGSPECHEVKGEGMLVQLDRSKEENYFEGDKNKQ